MSARRSRRLARWFWVTTMLLGVGAIALQVTAGGVTVSDGISSIFAAAALLGSATLGLVIVTRRPGNTIGWIFLGIGALWGLSGLASGYASFAVGTDRTSSLIAKIADWSGQWSWMPPTFLAPALIALLFPDGHPLSPRWRKVVWAGVLCTTVIVASTALAPGPMEDTAFLTKNPFGIEGAGSLITALGIAWFPMLAVFVASIASLVIRLRRARGEEREQMKWLAFAVGLAIVTIGVGSVLASIFGADSTTVAGTILIAAILAVLAFIPVAAGIAILKYRLYEIDVVINKTVVFGVLAAFISVVYVGIVVALGGSAGARTGSPVTSVVATAVVALLFQPARERVRRFANRLVYGKRATPYEVMAGFSRRMAGTLSVDQVLPEMAEAAARGVGAARSQVTLLLPDGGERAVSWPEGAGADGFARRIPVTFHGVPIGEIAIEKPPGEPFTPAEDKLLADLASQAGLAMHNVRLTQELEVRVQEVAEQSAALQISRQRLVTARDVQRRGLERDIREGAQRQLLDIGRRIQEAADLEERDPGRAATILDELGAQANTTLEGLRDLARGIFPPLLAEKGVVAALEAQVRKIGVKATIEAAPEFSAMRPDADTEAAVYFCCLQALQNVGRHAPGSSAVVRLSLDEDALEFSVQDDGAGFDPVATPRGMGLQIMLDRVEALGGSLAVASSPGRGTTITGRVPASASEAA